MAGNLDLLSQVRLQVNAMRTRSARWGIYIPSLRDGDNNAFCPPAIQIYRTALHLLLARVQIPISGLAQLWRRRKRNIEPVINVGIT